MKWNENLQTEKEADEFGIIDGGVEVKPYSSLVTITSEKYCRIFGHKLRKYGDGIYCENCDEAIAVDVEVQKEKNRGTLSPI